MHPRPAPDVRRSGAWGRHVGMEQAVEAVVAITAPSQADRVRTLLERGRHDKVERQLARSGWWRPEAVEDVSVDPAAAVRGAAADTTLWSFERSGWVEVDVETAAERITDGYFALFVAGDGTVVFAPEGRTRYRSVR